MLEKILIANRGAIACRILRTLRELDVTGVAVYAEADRASLHVSEAPVAHCLGDGPASTTYLDTAKILEIARRENVEAIHPGYGFLSENAAFGEACEAAGIVFIGRSTASGPFDGTGWELDAIAAVFIGGAAVSGGVGTVVGSMIGGLVMAVLNNGLQLMGVGSDRTQIIKGLVLLAAVAFDVYNKVQGRPSIIGTLPA